MQDDDRSAGAHGARLERAFNEQAPAFEDARRNSLFTGEAQWLFERLATEPGDVLLDLAAGTGHAARSLAGRVRCAVALDVTEAMLEAGRRAALQAGVSNVLFMRGSAEAVPFLDGTFDVGLTRFALHHMQAPAAALSELVRCVRAGGAIGVADMVCGEAPELARGQDALERLRDGSHVRMLAISELERLLEALGVEQVTVQTRRIERPLGPWLEQSGAEPGTRAEIVGRLQAELAGGPLTGFQPQEREGEIWFVQVWASLVGRCAQR